MGYKPQWDAHPSKWLVFEAVVTHTTHKNGITHLYHGLLNKVNGNFRILKWRYLPYIRPIFQG